MLKTFDFTLKVNSKQESMLQQHVGASRFIYNQMLALKINLYNNYNTNISRIDLHIINDNHTLEELAIKMDKDYRNFMNNT